MNFNKRTRVRVTGRYAPGYDHPLEKIEHIISVITCKNNRKDYSPQKYFSVDFIDSSIKPSEKMKMIEAAQEPNENLELLDLVKEIVSYFNYQPLTFSKDIVPASWYTPEKCFKKTIYFTVEYREQEIDLRAKKTIKVAKETYNKGEEIGDFIIAKPSYLVLRMKFEYDKKCCEIRPEKTPSSKHKNFYQDDIDDAVKKANKLKKKGFKKFKLK